MKICDKCSQPKTSAVSISIEHTSFDLCHEHYQELMEFLTEKEKKLGRPKKNSEPRPEATM